MDPLCRKRFECCDNNSKLPICGVCRGAGISSTALASAPTNPMSYNQAVDALALVLSNRYPQKSTLSWRKVLRTTTDDMLGVCLEEAASRGVAEFGCFDGRGFVEVSAS